MGYFGNACLHIFFFLPIFGRCYSLVITGTARHGLIKFFTFTQSVKFEFFFKNCHIKVFSRVRSGSLPIVWLCTSMSRIGCISVRCAPVSRVMCLALLFESCSPGMYAPKYRLQVFSTMFFDIQKPLNCSVVHQYGEAWMLMPGSL